MWAPRLRAFFYCGPLVALPVSDGRFVALDRAPLRHLAAPAAGLEHAPEMAGVVRDAEGAANQGRDPLQRPQLVGEPARQGASQQPLLEGGALPGRQLLGPARHGFGRQRGLAVLLPRLNPAMHGSGRGPHPSGDRPNAFPGLRQLHGTTTTFFQARG